MILSYIFFNVVNVILQTVKSILTIKGNKTVAALANAIAYGLYTYLLVLIASDINLWVKIFGCAGANLIGVYVVKWFEEKREREKVWRIEATFNKIPAAVLPQELKNANLSYSEMEVNQGNNIVFYIYCKTKKETVTAKKIVEEHAGKYFVSESKI